MAERKSPSAQTTLAFMSVGCGYLYNTVDLTLFDVVIMHRYDMQKWILVWNSLLTQDDGYNTFDIIDPFVGNVTRTGNTYR